MNFSISQYTSSLAVSNCSGKPASDHSSSAGQVEPPAIYVGTLLTQPVRGGTNNASVGYELVEIGGIGRAGHLPLQLSKDRKIGPAKAFLGPIRESDAITVLRINR